MTNVDDANPIYETANEFIEMPLGRRDAARKTIGDNAGEAKEDSAVTRDSVADKSAVTEAVSVAMPFSADWASVVTVLSTMLDSKYDKRKTEATRIARETKKKKTIKNLIRYSFLGF